MQSMNSNEDAGANQVNNTNVVQRGNPVRVSNTNLISLTSIDAPTRLLPLGPVTLNRNDDEMISHRSPRNEIHVRTTSNTQSPAVK